MDDRSLVRLNKYIRTLDFGRANLADVSGTDAPQHLDTLEGIIKELNRRKASQDRGSAEPKDVLIDALKIDVQNITRTASAIGQYEAGFEKLFPPPNEPNPAATLTAADRIIGNLVELLTDDPATKAAKAARRAKFIGKGLPQDFAQHLVDDRGGIDGAKTTEDNQDTTGVESTRAIGKLVADGMRECNSLEAIWYNVYTRDPVKLRGAISALHLERLPQRPKKPATPKPQ